MARARHPTSATYPPNSTNAIFQRRPAKRYAKPGGGFSFFFFASCFLLWDAPTHTTELKQPRVTVAALSVIRILEPCLSPRSPEKTVAGGSPFEPT